MPVPGAPVPGTPAPVVPPSGLVTIVCTDIVGSTRYADTLGDQRWRAVLGTHNTLVRDAVARHGGTEVKHSGDGFLLTFTSTRAAVQFGVDVQEALADYRVAHPDTPLEVRIGVHAGEVERDGNDVVGRNVSLACRLCDVAAPGEVLVSSVVADLADSASDHHFGEGRVHRLAGIDRDVTARPASGR
jgi:class 3 adenylate cyclase